MKKVLFMLCLSVLFILDVGGGQAFAKPDQKDLDSYLKEIGWTQNGWTEQDFENYLSDWWGMSLNDYESINDLKNDINDLDLGPVVTAKSLQTLFDYYKGYGISKQDIEKELSKYDIGNNKLDDFRFINDLRYTIGPAAGDEKALKELLSDYNITRDELDVILAKNGKKLSDFKFQYDLYDLLDAEPVSGGQTGSTYNLDIIKGLLSEVGVDEQEFEKLKVHYKALDEKKLMQTLLGIEQQAEALPEFKTVNDLTETQLQQIVGLYESMLNALELKADYYLIKGNHTTPISLHDLMKLDKADGSDLKIVLKDLNGQVLADLMFTGDMIGSNIIKDTGQKVQNVVTTPIHSVVTKHNHNQIKHTMNGVKMPKTAGNYIEKGLSGILIVISWNKSHPIQPKHQKASNGRFLENTFFYNSCQYTINWFR